MPAQRSRTASTAPASLPRWLTPLGKAGYGAKGIVYGLVGILALLAALGLGGSVGGGKNALAKVSSMSFGQVLLTGIAIGLFAYAAYRIVQAWVDPGRQGDEAKGIGKRITYVISGLLHLSLGVYAASMVWDNAVQAGSGGSGGGGESTASLTGKLMSQPAGVWLVGLLGVVVVGVGLRQFQRAYQAKFLEKYRRSEMDAKTVEGAKRVGQAGLSARGVVFLMIGGFFLQAAIRHDPSESRGLGGSLQALLEQPYGRILLGLTAAGMIAYGLFCFSYVRYRDFQRT